MVGNWLMADCYFELCSNQLQVLWLKRQNSIALEYQVEFEHKLHSLLKGGGLMQNIFLIHASNG